MSRCTWSIFLWVLVAGICGGYGNGEVAGGRSGMSRASNTKSGIYNSRAGSRSNRAGGVSAVTRIGDSEKTGVPSRRGMSLSAMASATSALNEHIEQPKRSAVEMVLSSDLVSLAVPEKEAPKGLINKIKAMSPAKKVMLALGVTAVLAALSFGAYKVYNRKSGDDKPAEIIPEIEVVARPNDLAATEEVVVSEQILKETVKESAVTSALHLRAIRPGGSVVRPIRGMEKFADLLLFKNVCKAGRLMTDKVEGFAEQQKLYNQIMEKIKSSKFDPNVLGTVNDRIIELSTEYTGPNKVENLRTQWYLMTALSRAPIHFEKNKDPVRLSWQGKAILKKNLPAGCEELLEREAKLQIGLAKLYEDHSSSLSFVVKKLREEAADIEAGWAIMRQDPYFKDSPQDGRDMPVFTQPGYVNKKIRQVIQHRRSALRTELETYPLTEPISIRDEKVWDQIGMHCKIENLAKCGVATSSQGHEEWQQVALKEQIDKLPEEKLRYFKRLHNAIGQVEGFDWSLKEKPYDYFNRLLKEKITKVLDDNSCDMPIIQEKKQILRTLIDKKRRVAVQAQIQPYVTAAHIITTTDVNSMSLEMAETLRAQIQNVDKVVDALPEEYYEAQLPYIKKVKAALVKIEARQQN